MLSPAEFISILSPIASPSSLRTSSTDQTSSGDDLTTVESAESSIPPASPDVHKANQAHHFSQMVVLDVRSIEEMEMSGGGCLPTAMHLEPGE
jgi:hypothetical protein